MRYVRLFSIIMLIFLAGCQSRPAPEIPEAPPPEVKPLPLVIDPTAANSMQAVSWSEIAAPVFADGNLRTWADALAQSAIYYKRIPADRVVQFGPYAVTVARMHQACLELEALVRQGDPAKLQQVLQERYQLYRSVGNAKGNVLVTGYYEPLLRGSMTRSKRYFYPIYRRPPDLVDAKGAGIHRVEKGKSVKYYTRDQIDGGFLTKPQAKKTTGSLANRGLELVWVDNPIDAFFLHIQGSGRVLLDNGRMMRIGFDGTNGRTYVAIGQILISEGKIPHEEMTMPRLRQWLVDNPKEQKRLFFSNPSYVFFREIKTDSVGNINVPLTKDRSIATDHRLFPKGAPGLLTTTLPIFAPDGKAVSSWRPETRFVVNQDTGGAIRGAGRVDLFFGFGDHVEYEAGVMKQNRSRLYFIAPRTDLPQSGAR
ncbi:MAG: murein transglycosylase A [Magnetococcales bacterium]|nr:murein transglycosylase A [Magnetococcales bacterium]